MDNIPIQVYLIGIDEGEIPAIIRGEINQIGGKYMDNFLREIYEEAERIAEKMEEELLREAGRKISNWMKYPFTYLN